MKNSFVIPRLYKKLVQINANLYNFGLEGIGKGDKLLNKKQKEYIFGLNSVYSALNSTKRKLLKAYIKDQKSIETNSSLKKIQHILMQKCVQVEYVNKDILNQLSFNRPHQGVVMEVDSLDYVTLNIDTCFQPNNISLWIYLYKIKDPMNLGAILRTCFFFGVDRVIVNATDSCSLTPVVSKASSGAMEIMDLYKVKDDLQFLKKLKEYGWQIFCTTEPPKNLYDSNKRVLTTDIMPSLSKPTVLIFGNEGAGVPENIKQFSDSYVTIPSGNPSETGRQLIGSLNVSVALGILVHSLTKNKRVDGVFRK